MKELDRQIALPESPMLDRELRFGEPFQMEKIDHGRGHSLLRLEGDLIKVGISSSSKNLWDCPNLHVFPEAPNGSIENLVLSIQPVTANQSFNEGVKVFNKLRMAGINLIKDDQVYRAGKPVFWTGRLWSYGWNFDRFYLTPRSRNDGIAKYLVIPEHLDPDFIRKFRVLIGKSRPRKGA